MPFSKTLQQSVRPVSHPPLWLRSSSLGTVLLSLGFLALLAGAHSNPRPFADLLVPAVLTAMFLAVFLTAYSLWNLYAQHLTTDQAFRETDREFSSIFQNVLDGILILDNEGDCLDANPATAAILRFSRNKLIGQNIRRFLPDSRGFTQGWTSFFLNKKTRRGRTRLIAGDGTTLLVDFTAAANYLPGRHVLILCDVTERALAEASLITTRKQAELQIIRHLNAAEAARAEAEALRKSTLALSHDLAMDAVLDTLLQCISKIVPFETAFILFAEGGSDLIVAREASRTLPKTVGLALDASKCPLVQRVLFEHKAVLVPDTARDPEWRNVPPLVGTRAWLGVPLTAACRVLGILSLGTTAPSAFTTEHLRLAKSLAIPAAVAIQNARVHERAEIYATELELRLQQLRMTQKALERVETKTDRVNGN